MTARALALAALLTALLAGCVTARVVPDAERAVHADEAELAWRPAVAADLAGLYESVAIEGEVAAQLWRVYYCFAADGVYTGAALVLGGEHPEFQTLSGRWTLDGDRLDLGDGTLIRILAAPERLKLESEGGSVVLARTALQ